MGSADQCGEEELFYDIWLQGSIMQGSSAKEAIIGMFNAQTTVRTQPLPKQVWGSYPHVKHYIYEESR